MPDYDAIIIGGGHNGLACACYLARAGLAVLVLEQYQTFGGMTITEELTLPGFWSDVHASGYQLANLSPAARELQLAERGVELIEPDLPYAHAFSDGQGLVVSRDLGKTVGNIARFSARDAATWQRLFEQYLAGKDRLVASLFSPPPAFATAMAALEHTEGGMDEYRFSLQSLRSWCDENFEAERVKCLLGAFAGFVGHGPDDAGGAAITWLFAAVLQDAGNNFVKGGMQNVSRALVAYLQAHGGAIRTGATVDKILMRGERATGVRLRGGEEIAAGRLLASSVDPAQLVLQLLGPEVVGPEIAAKMARYEWGDATLVIYVALDGPVTYRAGAELGAAAQVHLTPPSIDAYAQASSQCRAGMLPATPLIVSWNDAALDPSRVPPGMDHKKFVVLGVPYHLTGDATGRVRGQDWDTAKEQYADYLVDMIAADYIPDLKARILKRVVHSPLDLERKLSSAVNGTICHGAMLPYQMGAMRPIPELGQYRSPVANVYLCGSGTHPAAGVSMGPGRNAAQVIYADLGLDFRATVGA